MGCCGSSPKSRAGARAAVTTCHGLVLGPKLLLLLLLGQGHVSLRLYHRGESTWLGECGGEHVVQSGQEHREYYAVPRGQRRECLMWKREHAWHCAMRDRGSMGKAMWYIGGHRGDHTVWGREKHKGDHSVACVPLFFPLPAAFWTQNCCHCYGCLARARPGVTECSMPWAGARATT